MNIKIDSNFRFSVVSIQYAATGELSISLTSDGFSSNAHYQYNASLGNGQSEEKPSISLLQYAKDYAAQASIKFKTKDTYRLMCDHLEAYGDISIDKVTTGYLQGFLSYLQAQGMKTGTVRLYFQKLACVLHDAYKNGIFDDRILQRVKRPRREQEKKSFLSETELKKLTSHRLSDEYNNIQTMFLFSSVVTDVLYPINVLVGPDMQSVTTMYRSEMAWAAIKNELLRYSLDDGKTRHTRPL